MSDERSIPSPRWYRTRNGQLLLAAVAVAGLYALTQHWEHTLSALPWLLLLACPLLHVFMHGGHGGHGGHRGHDGHDEAGRGPSAQGALPPPQPGAEPDASADATPDPRR